MHQLLNTLYITTEGSYLHLDHETLRVEIEGATKLQVPMHHLGGIVCFGNVMISPFAMHRCAEDGRFMVLLDRNGKFKARIEGPVSGNVLLRRAQHEALGSPALTLAIARNIIAGKIQNSRQILLRGAREADDPNDAAALKQPAEALGNAIGRLTACQELDQLRGVEGESARIYFSVFDRMVGEEREAFKLNGRSRRPPLDRMNALLSFFYALLMNDCVAAVEGVGLDPQMGFLHALRPGRAALALDLMEEVRSVLADRLALTLVNRRQITSTHFIERPGGAIHLNDDGRKEAVVAYQKRKQEEIRHPLLDQKMPFGLIPHVQARLLARALRGEMEEYIPFLYR